MPQSVRERPTGISCAARSIARLFDSLIRGYPIGSFPIWENRSGDQGEPIVALT